MRVLLAAGPLMDLLQSHLAAQCHLTSQVHSPHSAFTQLVQRQVVQTTLWRFRVGRCHTRGIHTRLTSRLNTPRTCRARLGKRLPIGIRHPVESAAGVVGCVAGGDVAAASSSSVAGLLGAVGATTAGVGAT